MDQLREKTLQDTEEVAAKPRFGLFSQPPPLKLGRPYLDSKPFPKRDQNGKIIKGLKNITSTSPSTGMTKSSYFSYPEYISYPYAPTNKKKKPFIDAAFKPSSGPRSIISSAYQYICVTDRQAKPSSTKQINGLRQITTNPSSYISSYLYQTPTSETPPLQKIRSEPQFKILEPFRSRVKKQPFFSPNSQVYDQSWIPHKPKYQHPQKLTAIFKPSSPGKSGYEGALQKFPEHIPCPPTETSSKKQAYVWKPKGANLLSRPSPSISLNRMNIIRSMQK